MATVAILDLDKPEIGIDPRRALDVGVKIWLELRSNRLHPEALAIASSGFAVETRASSAAVDHLHKNGPRPRIAFAGDGGECAAEFRPPDQRANPNVCRQ